MTFKFIQIELEAELTHTGFRQQRMKLGQMTRKLKGLFCIFKNSIQLSFGAYISMSYVVK